jgi:predicted RNase H-like nuclease (RuvC/YqgF family)
MSQAFTVVPQNMQAQWEHEREAAVRAAEQKGREQLEALRQQSAQERRSLQAETEQLRQELTALKQWREGTVRQLEALWQERDQAAASSERHGALQRELENARRERDAALEKLRATPRPPLASGNRVGVAILGVVLALVGFLGGVAIMMARNAP